MRRLSGQHEITSTTTPEQAVDATEISADIVRVRAVGSDEMFVGNDGTGSVDDTTGYRLEPGDTVAIRTDHPDKGSRSDVYVYGSSGDTLRYIAIA